MSTNPNREVTGSVQKKNGKWYLVINLYDDNGNRNLKWINTKLEIRGNKKNAELMLSEKLNEFNSLNNKSQNIILKREKVLFCDYIKEWLEIQKNRVDPVTYASDEITVRVHLYPYFQEKQYLVKDINNDIINQYFADKRNGWNKRKPLAETSLKRHCANITSILNKAVKEGYMPKENIDDIVKPKNDTKITPWYTVDQTIDLIKLLENKNHKLLLPVIIVSYYGLRREEVCGIKESDIDFNNHLLYIQGSMVTTTKTIEENGEIKSKTIHLQKDKLKNDSSRRTFPMTPDIEERFKKKIQSKRIYMELFGNAYNHEFDDYLLVHENGDMMTPDYITHTFGKFIKSNQLPKITFHGLRHSCASLLVKENVSMKEIQEWLGHASFNTTAKIYAHVCQESKENILNRLSERISS